MGAYAFVDQSCVRLALLRSDLSQAAVDGQLDARHESGVVRGQEQSRPGDLLRLTEAAQRHHRGEGLLHPLRDLGHGRGVDGPDRKSTRLNSSHGYISYAVFCLKKKKKDTPYTASSHDAAS